MQGPYSTFRIILSIFLKMIDLQNRCCNFLLFRFEDESIIYNLKEIRVTCIVIDVSKKSRAMLKNLIGRMYSNLVSYSEYSQSVKLRMRMISLLKILYILHVYY